MPSNHNNHHIGDTILGALENVEPNHIDNHSWDRQPGETNASWEAFRRYRDMPSSRRTITALQRMFENERAAAEDEGDMDNVPSVQYATLNEWANRYNWAIRVAAWDAEIDRVWQEESFAAIKEAAKRHWATSISMQEKGSIALKLIDPADLAASNPQEVRRLIEAGVNMERKALGMDKEEPSKDVGNAILVIQIVEQLEKQMQKPQLQDDDEIEGDYKEITS